MYNIIHKKLKNKIKMRLDIDRQIGNSATKLIPYHELVFSVFERCCLLRLAASLCSSSSRTFLCSIVYVCMYVCVYV